MKRLLLLLLLPLILGGTAYAAKPVPPALTMEGGWYPAWNPNPSYPSDQPGCAHEDFVQRGIWMGTIPAGETFEVTFLACDYFPYCGYQCTAPACDPPVVSPTSECGMGGPDGEGFAFIVEYSTLTPVTVQAIDRWGNVTPAYVEVIGQSPNRRITYYRATGCLNAWWSISSGTWSSGFGPRIPPGPYRVVITNTGGVMPEEIGLVMRITPAWPDWQMNTCPVEQQHLVP